MDSTRKIALSCLDRIFGSDLHPKDALDKFGSELDKRERAFAKELVYGVLRYRDYLDWLLDFFLKKRSGLSASSVNNLRLALYQLRFMRVPDWALVNEAVEMEKSLRGRPSVINAVLRNLIRHGSQIKEPEQDDKAEYMAISTSHPKWLVQRWIKRFGYDEALRLAKANNEQPPISIRLPKSLDRDNLIELLRSREIDACAAVYSPVCVTLAGASNLNLREIYSDSPSSSMDELHQGLRLSSVQDEASQLVSLLLAPQKGLRVLDACAAPGGKTLHMADLMDDSGEIVAVESDKNRIPDLESNIIRLGLKSVKIVHADVRELSGSGMFDSILLDAPCSATGVIRRNPDIKYRLSRSDFQRLAARQLGMIMSVSALLKPGGRMVYSVCSIEPDEGEEVINNFLQKTEGFSIISEAPEYMSQFQISEGAGMYRTYPHRHSIDGFFAALIKRNI